MMRMKKCMATKLGFCLFSVGVRSDNQDIHAIFNCALSTVND